MRPSAPCLVLLIAVVVAEQFDYVIVGAGTSGLVVASRLSEDPSVSVAVIEAGKDERSNPLVRNFERFQDALGSDLNWNYTTTPQAHLNNRTLNIPSGRAWGGSSAINGMTYTRANREEIDAWEQLGNKGWNWDSLLPYYKKSETFFKPSVSQSSAGASYQPQYHGFEGPLRVGYRPGLVNTSTAPLMIETWQNANVSRTLDFNGGDLRGFGIAPQTVNPEDDDRWDAATAYLYPVEERPNLTILQGTVTRIIWSDSDKKLKPCASGVLARGVEYVTADGKVHTLDAGEVILSAGALRSPGILEASGVGNPSTLKKLGVETKVKLPGVGANYQDQSESSFVFSGSLEPVTGAYTALVTAAQIFGDDEVAEIEASTRVQLPAWARRIVQDGEPGEFDEAGVLVHLGIQHDLIFKHKGPVGEILAISVGGVIVSSFWPLFPFSRGSIHLSPDQVDRPLINPEVLQVSFDVDVNVALGRFVEKFWRTAPIRDHVSGRIVPSLDVLPEDAGEEEWISWFRGFGGPGAHAVGTASMMSRELGGVVDPELRVYGTRNVRVVDGSVVPMQISGHPTATLYAIAERAADIIKKAWA